MSKEQPFAGGSPLPSTTLRTVRGNASVEALAARLEQALTSAGMKIFARIDHAAEARAVGLTMPPAIVLIFGNPKAGTPLMVASPTVAIDLPLKVLVWEDAGGAAWVTDNTPALLVQRHGLEPALAARLSPAGELLERVVTTPTS